MTIANQYPLNVFTYEVTRLLSTNWFIRNEANAEKFAKQFKTLIKEKHSKGETISETYRLVYLSALDYVGSLSNKN